MTDCNCDDDMTEDGHGHACPNSITVRLAAEYARGVADERARVVAWLRRTAIQESEFASNEYDDAADAIDAGRHEQEAT